MVKLNNQNKDFNVIFVIKHLSGKNLMSKNIKNNTGLNSGSLKVLVSDN
jgi:hypothetical protein